MLDVHPPHEPVHGVRDFLLHLFTITVGLFIALSLEAGVEALHHRHQREEAEATIRQELRENQEQIQQGAAQFKTERDGMNNVVQALEELSQGGKAQLHEGDFSFHQGPMHDSAWRTASSTGALSLMDYAQVQKFSDAYKEQDQLESIEELTLEDYLQLMPILSHHGNEITPERARDALPIARRALAHLDGMYFIGVGTLGSYEEALKK
jgi:hypothetical protein